MVDSLFTIRGSFYIKFARGVNTSTPPSLAY
nr:MAG TPA: hypothetical protein [Bacteriophage sp.]